MSAEADTAMPAAAAGGRLYLPVRAKFLLAFGASAAWCAFSLWAAWPWLEDLAALSHWWLAIFAVGGIAIVPGFLNAFLIVSLVLDRRPSRRPVPVYPSLTILVAAYNEEDSIAETLESVEAQAYPGPLEIIVIDDGSTDGTAARVNASRERLPHVRLLRQEANAGKSAALNRGLAAARSELIVTLDADSYLHADALRHLVERYLSDPPGTRAVAGSILVRNSRLNWVTRMQEWDYFHGIAAVKRVQSLYHGTLVAQGAFSLYERKLLHELGGWSHTVGEDIVLTWAMLERCWRVGHAEDAICFTHAPTTLRNFVRQRQRWSRGMIEAFLRHPRVLVTRRLSTFFIWWNLLFPWLDLAFTLCFLPGVLLALVGIHWVAGPMTLVLIPLSLFMNVVMYRVGLAMFDRHGLRVRRNLGGFTVYTLAYSVILQPACVWGYASELFGARKSWGTK